MEHIQVKLSDEDFDAAVHGPPEGQPSLPEAGDMAIYVKRDVTTGGNAGAVVTFTVKLPDGTLRRVQAVNTVNNFINALSVLKGWRDGGHLS